MRAFEATSGVGAAITCLALAAAFATARADEPIVARVKGDRVNMRARAETAAEVVGQATQDEHLVVVSVEADWVQVTPPERVDLWVHGDFVKDGASSVDKLNVRAGPGINYSVVGNLSQGERMDVRGQFGDWVKIAPTDSTVWVSRELVDLVYPAQPAAPAPAPIEAVQPAAAPGPEAPALDADSASAAARAPATPAPATVSPPADLRLVPLEGQGRLVQREGELMPAPFLFGRPSKFRLVSREGAQLTTLCYVRGNTEQLTSLLDERLIIRGREYWVQGVRQPVVVLERIERFPR